MQGVGGVDVILSFSPPMKQNTELLQGLRPRGRFVTTAVSGDRIEADPVSMLFKRTSIIGSDHNNLRDLVDVLDHVV